MQMVTTGSGEPAWVIAPSSAGKRLGPDPRRALGPAATPAASTGRTRDRTRPMLQKRQKVLARAPSTRDPSATSRPLTGGARSGHFSAKCARIPLSDQGKNMRRREFVGLLGGTAATWSRAVRAQQVIRPARLGYIWIGAEDSEHSTRDGMRKGLR